MSFGKNHKFVGSLQKLNNFVLQEVHHWSSHIVVFRAYFLILVTLLILAAQTSTSNAALWCNVQLTKDAVGICLPDLNLSNSTNIFGVFPNKTMNYLVNGVPTSGYFSVDYNFEDLSSVTGKFNLCRIFSFVVMDSVFCGLIDSFVTHFVLRFKIFSMFSLLVSFQIYYGF